MKKSTCSHEKAKICSNVRCPVHSDYCPVSDKPGVCKYESRAEKPLTKEVNKWIVTCLVIAAVSLCIIALAYWIHKNNTEYSVREYSLVELSDGVYGTLTQVSSSIPAQNYSMVTLCCDGNIYTFKGNVEIKYADDTEPYVKIHDYNITNGDHIWICVPSGTIEFQKGVGVG